MVSMMSWVKKLFAALCFVNALMASSLNDKIKQGHAGDFIVTEQEGHVTLLVISSLDQKRLVLEEISIPALQMDLKKIKWQEWVSKKAPGHTSWIRYTIDLDQGKLIHAFSLSQKADISNSQDLLFAKLLLLPLNKVSTSERKKIGICQGDEVDNRSVWNPPLIVNGKRMKPAAFDVFKIRWPSDGSPLAGSPIELYFATPLPSFPFPFWIEVQSPHYTFKWRVIDSGSELVTGH